MFEFLRDFPLTVFGIVMERPPKTPYKGTQFLQTHYRWLLEQIERFMEQEQPDRMAIPVFDNLDPHSDRLFADCLTAYMARSRAGKALQHVVPSPLFADSTLTPGVQIADLCAYVVRMAYEHNLGSAAAFTDPYFSALRRFSDIVRSKTRNFPRDEGGTWYGIWTMSERAFVYEPPPQPSDYELPIGDEPQA